MSTITKTIPAVNTRTGKPRYSSRGGAEVRLLVLHTMEGARTVDACGAWFRNPDAPNASSHVGIDDRDTALYVPYEYSAWTAASANPVADQAELAAFAKWSKVEWDAHPGMIERTAQWVAERARARGIPLVRLRDKDTKTGAGVCMHVDITRGWGVGTHTDCGANFPIDRIIARAIQINALQEDDLDANQAKMLQEIHDELFKRLPNRVGPNASQEGDGADTILGFAANADGYGTRIERYLHSDEFADRIATRLLNATVEPALTMKDGNVTSQKISVTQALTRAQEASIIRQRGEVK